MFNFRPNYERLLETFELSDNAKIPVGEYDFYGIECQINSSFAKPFVGFLNLQAGQFYDGSQFSTSFTAQYNVSASLELNATYAYNNINFKQRNQKFLTHLARLKVLYMFSTQISIASFIQYNSNIKSYLANIRFRYNPKEGNDLYIVLNGDQNFDLEREIPALPDFSERTLLIKYSYTFRK